MALSVMPAVNFISAAGVAAAAAGTAIKAIPTAVQFVRDLTTISPTQAAAQNTIVARAYVEDTLATMDITPKVLKAVQVTYAGMVVTILERSNEIIAGTTVNDQLNKVWSRGMGMEAYKDVGLDMRDICSSVESLKPVSKDTNPLMPSQEDDSAKPAVGGTIVGDFDIKPADLLPVGQMLKVTLAGKSAGGDIVKQQITLTVRVTPFITAAKSMELILGHGAVPSAAIRKLQLSAGETSFWHDYVFKLNRLRKMDEAARADKTGAYAAFLKDTTNRDSDRYLDILYNLATPKALSANLANSIAVVTEETLLRAGVEAGVNFNDPKARANFFRQSYMMMLVVIDPHYHTVTIYMYGFENGHQYSFDDFSPKKKMDANDFLQMFSSMGNAAGRGGRF